MFDLKVPLRERPEKVPDFSKVKGVSNSLVIGGDLQKMYQFLSEHPDERLTCHEKCINMAYIS